MSQPKPVVTEKLVQKKPWRYIGYRGFSEWMASDDDFFVLRTFDSLAARTLLLLQWKISVLEGELTKADRVRSNEIVVDVDNGSFAADDDERQDLILNIKNSLTEYYTFLDVYSNMRSRPRSTKESVENVRLWLEFNHPGTIREEEANFINIEDELINVHATHRSPLRRWLEKFAFFRNAKIFKRHHNPRNGTPTLHDPKRTIYHRNDRLDNVINLLICIGGFAMLVAPLWILLFVQTKRFQLAIITSCSALFLLLVQSVSSARAYESLAATAAYTAVLMVFMQINPNDSG